MPHGGLWRSGGSFWKFDWALILPRTTGAGWGATSVMTNGNCARSSSKVCDTDRTCAPVRAILLGCTSTTDAAVCQSGMGLACQFEELVGRVRHMVSW